MGPAQKALARLGLTVHPSQPGGYYLWVELPEGMTELGLARSAAERGIFLAPGSVFYPQRQGARAAIRVNVAYANDPRFLRFLQGALKALG